jgi:histone deacetylase complex subunit SAP18
MPGSRVDREKTCPLLLRVFLKVDARHTARDFEFESTDEAQEGEVQIHTWKDASLAELVQLLMGVHDLAAQRSTRILFSLAYPGKEGKIVIRPIGQCFGGFRKSDHDTRTLQECGFATGDFMGVALLTPDIQDRLT